MLWDEATWDREFQALADIRVSKVTVRNPMDKFFPGYSSKYSSTAAGLSAACALNYTAFFDVQSSSDLRTNACVRQFTNATEQPLTLLVRAAAKRNIQVVLGLAWSGSAPKDGAVGLQRLAALQRSVATQLWWLYGDVRLAAGGAVLVGAYTEVEQNNCHGAQFNADYISHYLTPVSAHIRSLAGSGPPPFIFADPYFIPTAASDGGDCLSATEYGEFWRKAFVAAPAFTLIAPQDGVGAHNLSLAARSEFLAALRQGSHDAGRRFGVLVELFEQFPLGEYNQPTCEHRRPAPWSRILSQLQQEARYVDDMEFTAWEFHSYLSPLPGPCAWAAEGRNGSAGLYQRYKAYVDGLFAGQ